MLYNFILNSMKFNFYTFVLIMYWFYKRKIYYYNEFRTHFSSVYAIYSEEPLVFVNTRCL